MDYLMKEVTSVWLEDRTSLESSFCFPNQSLSHLLNKHQTPTGTLSCATNVDKNEMV